MRPVQWISKATASAVVVALLFAAAAGLMAMTTPRRVTAATTTVQVGQQNGGAGAAFQFNAAAVNIHPNDTVHWTLFSGIHTVVAFAETTPGTPDWSTPGTLTSTFDHAFASPGVYTYYCSIHALRFAADPATIDAKIAAGAMVGKVTVTSASVGGIAEVPLLEGGEAPTLTIGTSRGGFPWWQIGASAIASCLGLLGGALVLRRGLLRR